MSGIEPCHQQDLLERTSLHIAETSDDDTPMEGSKQQSSSGKHSSKVSADKSHTGNVSSLDHGTSDSGSESPEEMPTPVGKAQAGLSKAASVSKS